MRAMAYSSTTTTLPNGHWVHTVSWPRRAGRGGVTTVVYDRPGVGEPVAALHAPTLGQALADHAALVAAYATAPKRQTRRRPDAGEGTT